MTLEKAISYAIDNEGIEIISESRFTNYLNDLQAFDTPALKRVISTMIEGGYFAKLQTALSLDNYELQFNDVSSRLVQDEGFQDDLVKYVLDCLLYAVHKTGNTPTKPQSAVAVKKSTTRKKSTTSDKHVFNVTHVNDNYLVEIDGQPYELNESQYKAIMRKKDMPTDRLEVWLKSYADENK